MYFSNAHKSLVITVCISISVILMGYNFHIKQADVAIAETFYELLPEDTENLPNPESLEDILKSFDALNTNKAHNEQKTHQDFEDNDFKETMEKLQSRHQMTAPISATTQSHSEFKTITNDQTDASFEAINAIIKKTSATDASNKNSTISFSLVDREKVHIPPPIYLCEASGKIVISITVDSAGNVIDAQYNNASSSNNGCLVEHAIEYAKASTFSASSKRSEPQLGTITFLFRGKTQ